IGIIATNADFPTNDSRERFNSSSSEPSKTIKISPMVPKTVSISDKSGIVSCKKSAPCFTAQPQASNNITDGILVRDAVTSKIYAKRSRMQIVIKIEVVIFFRIYKNTPKNQNNG